MPEPQEKNITLSLSEYQGMLMCKEFVEKMAESVASSESMIGPKVCHHDSVPRSDASILEKVKWSQEYVDALRKISLDYYSVKKKLFSKSSGCKANRNDDNDAKKEVERHNENKNIDALSNENSELNSLKKEYKKTLNLMQEAINQLENLDKNNSDIVAKRNAILYRIKILRQREKILEGKIKIIDLSINKETKDASNDTSDDIPESKSNSNNINVNQDVEIDYDKLNEIIENIFNISKYDNNNNLKLLLPEIIDIIEKINKYTKESEKNANEAKNEFLYLNKIAEKFFTKALDIKYISTDTDNTDVYKYFFDCKNIYEINKNRIISSHIYRWDIHQEVECITKTFCTDINNRFEINPASTFNPIVLDKNNNLLCKLNTFRVLNDDPEENKLKAILNEKYHYPKELLDIMAPVKCKYTGEDVLVISPTEFAGMLQFIFGAAPSFVGKHTSLYSLTLMISEVLSLFTTKSKLSSFYKMQHGDCVPNRQQFILDFNGFARCLKGLEELQRKILIKNSKTILADETFINCLEFTNVINVVFSLASGKHDKLRGVSYSASNTRSTEEFLNLFLKDENTLLENIMALTTDCCPIYFSPEIKETLINVKNSVCHSHARRRILEDLGKLKLDKLFLKYSKLQINEFLLSMKNDIDKNNIYCGKIGSKLLLALFLLEIIFKLEKDFSYQTGEVIKSRRQKYSKPIMDIYFSVLEDLASEFQGVTHTVEDAKEKWQGTGINIGEYSVLYILNHKQMFLEFLEDGDIEITNNLSELFLREIARYRDCMEFFATIDGIKSFMILESLTVTASINHINKFFYLLWVMANYKVRSEYYRLENIKNNPDNGSKQIFLLPRKQTKTIDGKKESIRMYDPNFTIPYDKISTAGFESWNANERLKTEFSRIKNFLS